MDINSIIIKGNIFQMQCDARVITTNGIINNQGEAVMGTGSALAATQLYPDLTKRLGKALYFYGNRVYFWPDIGLFTLPTKHHWKDSANIDLIDKSLDQLVCYLAIHTNLRIIRMVIPGQGSGSLSIDQISPMIQELLYDINNGVDFKLVQL